MTFVVISSRQFEESTITFDVEFGPKADVLLWDEPTLKLLGTLNRSQQTPADGEARFSADRPEGV